MLSHRPEQTAYLQALTDGLLLAAAFVLAFEVRSYLPLPFVEAPAPLSFAVHFWALAFAVPLFWALCNLNGDRAVHVPTSVGGVLRSVLAPFIYFGLMLGTAIFLFQAKSFSRAVFFLFLLFGLVLVSAGRLLFLIARRRASLQRQSSLNLLIVGIGDEALGVRRTIESHPEYGMSIVGHLAGPGEDDAGQREVRSLLGRLDDLKQIVEERVVDEVIFVLPPADLLRCEQQIAWCDEVGVTVHLKIDFLRTLVAKAYPTSLDGTPLLTFTSTPADPAALLVKRAVDIAGATLALAVLSPLMLVAACAVRLTSAGPAIFSQQRLGRNGRLFELLKFRSMYRDAESRKAELAHRNEVSGPVFKIRRDPRITPLGRWLRRFSIDELPQLWNVLRGDMSLVGPRPPLADEVKRYARWQKRRLSMKPGITCLWQVNGRSHVPFEEWMRLDLEYIDNWSLALDLKILLRTVPAVVLARGAR